MSTILLSIIIPTCNRPDLLKLCLDTIAPGIQTIRPDIYEVIVTDDGNTTAEELIKENYSSVKWVKGPQKGPAANRNNGAKHAIGEWLVFTDDDCLPAMDWLEGYYNAIRQNDKSIEAFEGAIYPVRPFHPEWEECPVNITGGYFWSANIAVAKELFLKVKGFDENYPTADLEDMDLYYSLLKHTKIEFLQEAKVIHPVRKINFWKDLQKNKFRAKIWAYHAIKHKERFGYEDNYDIMKDSFKFYVKDFIKNLLKLRIITAIKRLYFILIGIPLLMVNLSKLNKRYK